MKFQKITRVVTAVVAATLTIGVTSCSKPFGSTDSFIKIGRKTYTIGEYKSFSSMQYNHPDLARKGFFPGKRYASTLFVETELLYNDAKVYETQVVDTKDWEWKNVFILGQHFLRNNIQANMGATRDEVKKYFKDNKGTFLFEGGANVDTSFNAHFLDAADKLFLSSYPPSEAFKKSLPAMNDESIKSKWLDSMKKNRVEFFRDTYYEEQYGALYPTDFTEIFGEGKLITPADLDIVSKWLPEATVARMSEKSTKKEIIGYMAGWKLFAAKAKEKNVDKSPQFTQFSKYFRKYEIVRYYLNTILTDKLGSDIGSINHENLQFAYLDRKGSVSEVIDTTLFNSLAAEIAEKKTNASLLKYIADIRKESNVTFIHSDYKDEMAKGSERIFFEADSLTNTGDRDMAKKLYRDLIKYYPFTQEGIEAHRAIAMLFSDDGSYNNAIRSYREYLLLSEPSDDWCKVYFMIGYTYGENLEKLELAAANYRWILKNRPDCDLIDDAEFMYLHLGEPMSDVDELQAENARQGRSIIK